MARAVEIDDMSPMIVVKNRRRPSNGHLQGELQLNDHAADAKIHIDQITFLGSIRDECGSVPARANAVQFEGNGTYNGNDASFPRVRAGQQRT